MAIVGDSAVRIAKDSLFLDTATGADLDRLGNAVLVHRPRELGLDEEKYRKLVQLLGFQPKQVIKIVYQLLDILFGSQADLIAGGRREWRVFEVVVNELIVEIPFDLTAASNTNATYLHGLGSDLGYTNASTTQFLIQAEDYLLAASSLAGLTLSVLIGGVYTNFTIVSNTYDLSTGINTINVVGVLPANTKSLTWRIVVPNTVSFDGDYLLGGASNVHTTLRAANLAGDTVVRPLASTVVFRQGDGVIFERNNPPRTEVRTVDKVLGDTLVLSSGLTFSHALGTQLEKEVEASFVNNSQVILFGEGLIDVFREFMTFLVKASGIKLRIERIGPTRNFVPPPAPIGGWPLVFNASSFVLPTTEATSIELSPIFGFDPLIATTKVTARVSGSLSGFTGTFLIMRVRQRSPGAPVSTGTLLGTYPTVTTNGDFSLNVTITPPPAGELVVEITFESNTTPGVTIMNEMLWILETE